MIGLALLAGRIVPASCHVPVDPCLDGGEIDLTGPLIGVGVIAAAVVVIAAVVILRWRQRRD